MSPSPARIDVLVSEEAEPLLPPGFVPAWLADLGQHALPFCLTLAKPGASVLADLTDIEVTLLSDREIALVHGEFLSDPTPTDVITFHHGEILISVETAERQAVDHGHNQPVPHEIALYLVHGLLHLAGWDDHDPAEAAQMAAHQEQILQRVLAGLSTS